MLIIAALFSSISTSAPAATKKARIKTGIAVPYASDHARSPYTRPAKLVKLDGARPGDTIICPYTKRPFIVPGQRDALNNAQLPTQAPSKPVAKSKIKPKPKATTSKPVTKPQLVKKQLPSPAAAAAAPTPDPAPAPLESAPSPTPALLNPTEPAPSVDATPSAPNPIMSEPETTPTSQTTAATPPTSTPSIPPIPYAENIPGQPGFVRSPFAQPHQLVDVVGLTPGSEVKCPYSGRIFRVPSIDRTSPPVPPTPSNP
ncbi:hypothetical protein FEM03_22530 [Phragmitibacter flavus]|uniref:Uncharacterized protein n=1 Tax=Phragmitibacter flavus TaxID=2576071 RepID=A0A5R8K843_9BACT|nr:hypothetical protein FEM03_22530 [Phragmitibacter flavus]